MRCIVAIIKNSIHEWIEVRPQIKNTNLLVPLLTKNTKRIGFIIKIGDPMKKINKACLTILTIILLLSSSNAMAQTNPDKNGTSVDMATYQSPDQNYPAFLPIIMNEPGFVLLPNGNFEQGPVVWTEYSTNGYELIYFKDDLSINPYEGSWVAWLGGLPNETSYIVQQVSVSAKLPYLSYQYWVSSSDQCNKDLGGVFIDDVAIDTFSLCTANNTGGWVNKIEDLHAYAGSSVSIKIQAVCDGANNSNLFIDYVGFKQ
jgi:hypothetical protein